MSKATTTTVEWEGEASSPAAEVPADVPAEPAHKRGAGKWIAGIVILVVLVVAAVIGSRLLHYYAGHAVTDNAQIEARTNPVINRVPGYVREVLVTDNQRVRRGDVLVRVDDRDLRTRVRLAEAAVSRGRAAKAAAQAGVEVARVARDHARLELQRLTPLQQQGELSRQQYDAARSAADGGGAQFEMARRQVDEAAAAIEQAQAELEAARLQLSYATLLAPADGVVSRKSVEVGQMVQPGQPLMALVEAPDFWVVANFKETQLRRVHVGQEVTIEVDAYPHREFAGRVESIASATGAKFALLPPDNATGNFTKVVQRVPVRIALVGDRDAAHPLRAGMSVSAAITLD